MKCCAAAQTIVTTLFFSSHIDIFKAVNEGHVNRSMIGTALISETVTVFVTNTSIFFFFPLLVFSFFFFFFFFFFLGGGGRPGWGGGWTPK